VRPAPPRRRPTNAPPIKNNPRKVVIIGDSLLFKDQDPLYTEVERDGKWDVVDVYAELGATTYRHEWIDSILANTNYDAVVLSFGYNEISDVRGDIQDPIPESAVRQSWADTVRVAKTQCLGWMTMEYAGWQKIGASENSLMMRMIRWMNNFMAVVMRVWDGFACWGLVYGGSSTFPGVPSWGRDAHRFRPPKSGC
jgi:hypothetical protein